MQKKDIKTKLLQIYQSLFDYYGPQHWWPGDTPFEVAIGAILTQNTNWRNVAKAINNLKEGGYLEINNLYKLPKNKLSKLIKPSGYFNIKADKIRSFLEFLCKDYEGKLELLFNGDLYEQRKKLLKVKGIGPETADSILLYAGNYPIFVIDAYTKRVFSRHEIISAKSDYYEIQEIFMNNLPQEVKLFNEYHALIVMVGKEYCNRIPHCTNCPLEKFLRRKNS